MRLWIYYFTAAFFVTASMSGQAQTYATVRVLTVFTNEAMVFYPVVPAGVAQAEIGKTNQALITSGASVRVENAGVLQINLPLESVGPSLYRAKYDIRILKARDTYNADVVIIIHDVYGGGGLALESPATKPENAMAMISVASIPGNEFGYQHEIAHLMGANHQSDGGVSANSSAPSIGKAWYWRNKFAVNSSGDYDTWCMHTIMAYEPISNFKGVTCSPNSTRQLRYSNPAQCQVAGIYNTCFPWGDPSHNNSMVISQYGPTLVSFRNTKLAPSRIARVMQAITSWLKD